MYIKALISDMSKKIEVDSSGTTNNTPVAVSTLTVTPTIEGGKGPVIPPPPILPTSRQKPPTGQIQKFQ